MRVLILGAGGMIGHTIFRVLSKRQGWEVSGTVRSHGDKEYFPAAMAVNVLSGIDFRLPDVLVRLLAEIRPSVVVNCVGLTKHIREGNIPSSAIEINALLPHRLAQTCDIFGARFIQISTDCVFSGRRGQYNEQDFADADDIYGRSKRLGEVDQSGHLTIRTSTIGHETKTKYGLLEWFLTQRHCKAFDRAIFSGFPTVVLAEIIRDVIIPNPKITGLYHLAADPISKAELLKLVADIYGHRVDMVLDHDFVTDRSLDASNFNKMSGYLIPTWPELVHIMHDHAIKELNWHV